MGVFDDQKLEKLDWMTQMTETIESDLNTMLAKLPSLIPVTARDILDQSGSSYMSLSARDIISKYFKRIRNEEQLSWDEQHLLEECFQFETRGDTEIDLRTGILSGEIYVIKIKETFSDEELQPLMGRRGIEHFGRASEYGNSEAPLDRLNEVLDILGNCSEAMKTKSGKKKAAAIKARLTEIFKTNEWRIRDMTLANKVCYWIKGYIDDGNLANLTNLCKLKVMTHNNMPIYSVKEEV